jgi:hypothetical protein
MLVGVSASEQTPIFANQPPHQYPGKLTHLVQICYHKDGSFLLDQWVGLSLMLLGVSASKQTHTYKGSTFLLD